MVGVATVRGREVGYFLAPTISSGILTSDEVLLVKQTRARTLRVVVHYDDGTRQKLRIAWDAPRVGPLGATASGSWEVKS
jgi:hypothetical protein